MTTVTGGRCLRRGGAVRRAPHANRRAEAERRRWCNRRASAPIRRSDSVSVASVASKKKPPLALHSASSRNVLPCRRRPDITPSVAPGLPSAANRDSAAHSSSRSNMSVGLVSMAPPQIVRNTIIIITILTIEGRLPDSHQTNEARVLRLAPGVRLGARVVGGEGGVDGRDHGLVGGADAEFPVVVHGSLREVLRADEQLLAPAGRRRRRPPSRGCTAPCRCRRRVGRARRP